MIKISNTPNLTGVSIMGDGADLRRLVDAFYDVMIGEDDEKNWKYMNMSTRALGLCYDIRHASMGDREIVLTDNQMNQDIMRFHNIITPDKNVYYRCNCLYPEMFYNMIALNRLIALRMKKLSKSRYNYDSYNNRAVVWDESIAYIRLLQSSFSSCVKETMTQASYMRWLKLLNDDYIPIQDMAGQYLDLLNLKYIDMTREKREKTLLIMAKRIAEFQRDRDYLLLKKTLKEAAEKYNCPESEIRNADMEYPENIEW